MNLKVSLGVLIILLLQACSSLEVTQSRYGNGIGVSWDRSSKSEEVKADEFRKRKRDEFLDRNHKVIPKTRGIKPLVVSSPLVEKVPRAQGLSSESFSHESVNTRPTKESGISMGIIQETTSENKDVEPVSVRDEQPETTQDTKGDTYNLGYIGVILIIAGLVLLLVGVGQGFAIVVLGVVLILLAYFLG